MAKKSKTQKAKASAARQARKLEREREEALVSEKAAEGDAGDKPVSAAKTDASKESDAKKGLKSASKRADSKSSGSSSKKQVAKSEKKAEQPKKQRFQFLRDVKAELKRVTWPTKQDVAQWSVVVVAALVFFGVFVAILDNLIITPALVGVSSIEVQADESAVAPAGSSSDAATADTESTADEAAVNDEVAATNEPSTVDETDEAVAEAAAADGSGE